MNVRIIELVAIDREATRIGFRNGQPAHRNESLIKSVLEVDGYPYEIWAPSDIRLTGFVEGVRNAHSSIFGYGCPMVITKFEIVG